MLRSTKLGGAKDEARLIETSAKRSYVPVVYYGSRRLYFRMHTIQKLYVLYVRAISTFRCEPSRVDSIAASMHVPVRALDISRFNFIQLYSLERVINRHNIVRVLCFLPSLIADRRFPVETKILKRKTKECVLLSGERIIGLVAVKIYGDVSNWINWRSIFYPLLFELIWIPKPHRVLHSAPFVRSFCGASPAAASHVLRFWPIPWKHAVDADTRACACTRARARGSGYDARRSNWRS